MADESRPQREITDARLEKYLALTGRALERATLVGPDPSYTEKMGKDFMGMARAYYADAKHFAENGDYVNAFACVNYAHAWIDAAARMGFVQHHGDEDMFTLQA